MAPPAAKRRKLEHSDDSDPSNVGFSDSNGDSASAHADDAEDGRFSDEDLSLDDGTVSEDGYIDNDDGGSVDENGPRKEAQVALPNPQNDDKMRGEKLPQTQRGRIPQDGVYTAEVYKSNVFKLQVDELLAQVKPKYGKKEAPAEQAMRTLKTIIEQIPSQGPYSIAEAEAALKKKKIMIPFPNPRPPKDAKYKLQFERPSNINATGSYPLRIATRTEDELTIDLVLTLPQSLLQEKDYLNHRYIYKRAFFLACIAAGIKGHKDQNFHVTFDHLNGNHLQPVIVVRSGGGGGEHDFSSSNCRIQIIPALPEKAFPETKLLPTANCIRPKTSDETEQPKLSPTPFYNATVQSDAVVTTYLKLLHGASGKNEAYKDACVLGRVWLRQRGFGGHLRKGGFGNFEWAAIMALLLQPNPGAGGQTLSPGYSSYQLFKATLQFLGNRNLVKSPYAFQASGLSFPKHGPTPIFFDGHRSLNILYKMTPWSYARLQHEAKLTVQMLSSATFDYFEQTFVLKANALSSYYDALLDIPLSGFDLDPSSQDYDEELATSCQKLHTTLVRAATDRITGLFIQLPDETGWQITSPRPPEPQSRHILVGFRIDAANANRTIDLGPAAEEKKEAASFRKFWGEKAELRRFKDGSISESVAWSVKDTKASVLEQMVLYVLRKHLGDHVADGATFVDDSFSELIPAGRIQGQSGTAPFYPLMDGFSTLERAIRDLEGLPLQIRHIVAADEQLRYSSVRLPVAPPKGLMDSPASIVLQFEGSTRWPDDLPAIQRTKVAFLLKLSELLTAARSAWTSRVGLENPSEPSQNQAFLEIILPAGRAFHLRVFHEREATLLARQLKDKTLDHTSRQSAANGLTLYQRNFVQAPAHSQAIRSLSTRFPALSPAIRLTKQWFASHLLSPHFSPEFIELLVARTFLQPHPWPVPACATTAFVRTLAWISRWDWRHVPLVVDFSSGTNNHSGAADLSGITDTSIKADDLNEIQVRFEAWRKIDPSLNRVVLFAATNLDREGTTWTDHEKPEKVVAARMTALARAAMSVIKAEEVRILGIVNGTAKADERLDDFVPETLFSTNLHDYDFVLHMAPKHTKVGQKRKESKFKNLQIQEGALGPDDVANVGYDAVSSFVEELKDVYGHAVIWFWNSEAEDVVAGLWNPSVTDSKAFKVFMSWNSLPVPASKQAEVEINKGAMLNEIGRLGGELVERVEVRK